MTTPHVTADVSEFGTADAVDSAGHAGSVFTTFAWYASDPLAVLFTVYVSGLKSVQWRFGRDLLAEGLDQEVGIGDVKMGPRLQAGCLDLVQITVFGPDGSAAALFLYRSLIDRFLRGTYAVVPRGGEVIAVPDDPRACIETERP